MFIWFGPVNPGVSPNHRTSAIRSSILTCRSGLPGQRPPPQFDESKERHDESDPWCFKNVNHHVMVPIRLLAPRSWRHHRREAFRALDSLVGHPEIDGLYQRTSLITLNQPTTTAARDGGV